MNWVTLGAVLTVLLALYGAVLATLTTLAQYRSTRPRVMVTTFYGFQAGPKEENRELVLFLTATNIGTVPLTLSDCRITLPRRTNDPPGAVALSLLGGLPTQTQMPAELNQGQECKMWIETQTLAASLRELGFSGKVKIRGQFIDQADNDYSGQEFEFVASTALKHHAQSRTSG